MVRHFQRHLGNSPGFRNSVGFCKSTITTKGQRKIHAALVWCPLYPPRRCWRVASRARTTGGRRHYLECRATGRLGLSRRVTAGLSSRYHLRILPTRLLVTMDACQSLAFGPRDQGGMEAGDDPGGDRSDHRRPSPHVAVRPIVSTGERDARPFLHARGIGRTGTHGGLGRIPRRSRIHLLLQRGHGKKSVREAVVTPSSWCMAHHGYSPSGLRPVTGVGRLRSPCSSHEIGARG